MFRNVRSKISLITSATGGAVGVAYLMYKRNKRSKIDQDSSQKNPSTIDKPVEPRMLKDIEKNNSAYESQLNDSDKSPNEISMRWKQEYEKKGIPSSYRNESSSVVSSFFYPYFLKNSSTKQDRHVVDMGCGLGRNSIFFAERDFQVTSIDIVPENIVRIQEYAKKHGLKITALCGDITQRIPVEDNSVDIVIDIFCYKHQTDETKRESYRKELYRILKDDGYYLLSLAGKDDGYYGKFLKENDNKIIDPKINVASVLFDPDDIKKEFSKYEIKELQTIRKPGLMHGGEYERVTHGFIMKKNINNKQKL